MTSRLLSKLLLVSVINVYYVVHLYIQVSLPVGSQRQITVFLVSGENSFHYWRCNLVVNVEVACFTILLFICYSRC